MNSPSSYTNFNAADPCFTDINQHCENAYIRYLKERGIIPELKDDLFQPEDQITTEQFVTMMIRSRKGDIEPTRDSRSFGYMEYALQKGIIEDYDMVNKSNPIERRSLARIVHETLLTEFGEQDEDDWSAAKKLKDLYSCHTCVIHIAQVYVKGILLGCDDHMFHGKSSVTRGEAAAVIVRMLDPKERIPQTGGRAFIHQKLTPKEAWELMLQDNTAILVDVRTLEEYKTGHIEDSICIPLKELSNNPFSVCDNKNKPIILYCHKGYKSLVAAQVLIDAGYSRIYTIPGIGQYEYPIIGCAD